MPKSFAASFRLLAVLARHAKPTINPHLSREMFTMWDISFLSHRGRLLSHGVNPHLSHERDI
jgi:hypothetical protein